MTVTEVLTVYIVKRNRKNNNMPACVGPMQLIGTPFASLQFLCIR